MLPNGHALGEVAVETAESFALPQTAVASKLAAVKFNASIIGFGGRIRDISQHASDPANALTQRRPIYHTEQNSL